MARSTANLTSKAHPEFPPDLRLEKYIQRDILKWLESTGLMHWRQNSGALTVGRRLVRLGPNGAPDIVVVVPPSGRFLGLEVKSHKGRLRPAQKAFRDDLVRSGGLYVVVRSVWEAWKAVREAWTGEMHSYGGHLYRDIEEKVLAEPKVSPARRGKSAGVRRARPGTAGRKPVESKRNKAPKTSELHWY